MIESSPFWDIEQHHPPRFPYLIHCTLFPRPFFIIARRERRTWMPCKQEHETYDQQDNLEVRPARDADEWRRSSKKSDGRDGSHARQVCRVEGDGLSQRIREGDSHVVWVMNWRENKQLRQQLLAQLKLFPLLRIKFTAGDHNVRPEPIPSMPSESIVMILATTPSSYVNHPQLFFRVEVQPNSVSFQLLFASHVVIRNFTNLHE